MGGERKKVGVRGREERDRERERGRGEERESFREFEGSYIKILKDSYL